MSQYKSLIVPLPGGGGARADRIGRAVGRAVALLVAMAAKKRVIFLRHGQTAHNIPPYTAVLNTDNELTPAGEQQARAVNDQLKRLSAASLLSLDAVVVSPLSRSIQTGLIATADLSVPLVLTRESGPAT